MTTRAAARVGESGDAGRGAARAQPRAMPKVSRETASETIALEGLDVRVEHLEGGYSVCFESTPPTPTSPACSAAWLMMLPIAALGLRPQGRDHLPLRRARGNLRGR